MRLIKRYPNRKLYDTVARKYVTLQGIADLIRQDCEVQVVDHITGEDLTALILSQIIFEQEKKRAGFLPRWVLTDLLQAGGKLLSDWAWPGEKALEQALSARGVPTREDLEALSQQIEDLAAKLEDINPPKVL